MLQEQLDNVLFFRLQNHGNEDEELTFHQDKAESRGLEAMWGVPEHECRL